MKRILICIILTLLLFPVAGYSGKKDKKKGQDRKLVLVDETAFKKKVDDLMKSDTYKELDKTQQSLIRTFVETVSQKYAEEFTYERSEQGIQASLDSLDDLMKQVNAAEAANTSLRKECDTLEAQKTDLMRQLADLRAKIDAKDKELAQKDQELADELANKDKEVARMKQEVEDAQTQGSRALQKVSELTASLEANIQAARASTLSALNPSFYTGLTAQYDAFSAVLSLLDSQQDKKLKKEVEEMADLEAFRAIIAETEAYLAGPFVKDTRNRLQGEFKALDRKKSVLSEEQRKEIALYLSGVNHHADYVSDLEDFMQPLKDEGCLTREEYIQKWQNKLNTFKASHETLPDWPLMTSLQRAVNELSAFLKLDARGQIPVALADSDQFKSKLQSIWSIVENSEL